MFHYIEKVNKKHLKMLNVNYEKWSGSATLLFQ